jgi:hypothetical protein
MTLAQAKVSIAQSPSLWVEAPGYHQMPMICSPPHHNPIGFLDKNSRDSDQMQTAAVAAAVTAAAIRIEH